MITSGPTCAHTAWRVGKEYPSYLTKVAERSLEFLGRHDSRTTVFVVGKDLQFDENCAAVAKYADAGHEIANHSFSHLPWLDTLPAEELEAEVATAEQAVESVVGLRPRGFRAPGFSGSSELHELLARRGYEYDASSFPTVIGPLAAWYARMKSIGKGSAGPRQRFATLRSGFGDLRPHQLPTSAATLIEVPVTTMPLLRLPIHGTYLLYLAQFSSLAAKSYMRSALALCRLRGVGPSMLLHPLDFLGGDEVPELSFFPGMKLDWAAKRQLLDKLLTAINHTFQVGTVAEHARSLTPGRAATNRAAAAI